jgi:hypothetical protein
MSTWLMLIGALLLLHLYICQVNDGEITVARHKPSGLWTTMWDARDSQCALQT